MVNAFSSKHVIAFIWKMIRAFPLGLTVILLTTVIWAVGLSVKPYLLKILLNRAGDSSGQNFFEILWLPAAAYFFMSVFIENLIFRFYDYFVGIGMIPRMRRKIANAGVKMLLEKTHHYYQNQFAGSLASKLNDLTSSIPDILKTLERFLRYILGTPIAVYTLWQVNSQFALFLLVWASANIGVTLFFSKRIIYLADCWSEWGSVITGKMVDTLSNILSIKLFSREKSEKNSLGLTFDETVKAEQKLQWAYYWIWLTYGCSAVILMCLNLYFLIKGRQEGWVTIGDFALVITLNVVLIDFFWELNQEVSKFFKLFGRITQALRTFSGVPEIHDKPQAKTLAIQQGNIVFDNVHFNYHGADSLFQEKSVVVNAGQKVGLVGYSGSGKTTFVNLILRLYDVTAGRILIDNHDIRDVTQDSLHEAIGMIPQDPSLFHRTLRENISYGRPDATEAEIIEAARKAHAHSFIQELAQGYDSLVGERGIKLSGGQRQRIAIARAILKNAPVLILDEATSQLDSVTESYIQDSLWQVMERKTAIVIAHRLSTLLHMDRILVFDGGKIVEDGTHAGLLAKGGLYKSLWNAQVGGFLPEAKAIM